MSEEAVLFEVVRAAVRSAVAREGPRSIARAIGMSPTGLSKALSPGHKLRASTETKLRQWYMKQHGYIGLDLYAAHIATESLLGGIPDSLKPEARQRLADAIRRIYTEFDTPVPTWAERLLRSGREIADARPSDNPGRDGG